MEGVLEGIRVGINPHASSAPPHPPLRAPSYNQTEQKINPEMGGLTEGRRIRPDRPGEDGKRPQTREAFRGNVHRDLGQWRRPSITFT